MTESYFDIDGKPIGLAELCIREPGWAANRIRAMRATIDELGALIDQPAPVEWVDGRATVGDVTVRAFAPDRDVVFWSFDLCVGDPDDIDGNVCHVEMRDTDDEATAKRIAIAVAREMQR